MHADIFKGKCPDGLRTFLNVSEHEMEWWMDIEIDRWEDIKPASH